MTRVRGSFRRLLRRSALAMTAAVVGALGLSALIVLVLRCFRHQLLLPCPYLVLTKPLRLDIQCQRAASVKIGWKYLDD